MSTVVKSPRKPKSTDGTDKMKIEDVISSAKINFLSAADQRLNKSPLKRPSTPSPEKSKNLKDSLLSPASLKKAGIGSPPKKKPKLWKSKWQLATLSGGITDTGKKKRASEASRLLDDEGVIHMLNRVPSVYGEVPLVAGASNSRVHRARSAANKQKPVKQNKPRQQTKVEKMKIKVENDVILAPAKPVKMPEISPSKIKQEIKEENTILSPRRTSRNLTSALHGDLQSSLTAAQSEDCFIYLKELPSELLESVMNCDIRYSLPHQGLPREPQPSKPNHSPAKPNQSSSKPPNRSNQPSDKASQSNQTKPNQSKSPGERPNSRLKTSLDSNLLSKVKREPPEEPAEPPSTAAAAGIARAKYSKTDQFVSMSAEARLADIRVCMANDRLSPVKSPGAFSEIYVRLYESFAQVTIAPSKTKLTASLGPSAIDEIIRLLNFVAATKMYKGVLLTGVGNVFCQGVDLMFLCDDSMEKRKDLAKQLASAVERLILALSGFPKVLVAAVNGLTTGLGVSILPLCDVVYASEKALFNSHAARLGHIPEGGASISMSSNQKSLKEMFVFGRQLTALELQTAGLVSEVFLSGRLMEETIPRIKRSCSTVNPGLQWNKMILNQSLKSQMTALLPGETEILSEMWCNKDFYKGLVNFIATNKSLVFQKPS